MTNIDDRDAARMRWTAAKAAELRTRLAGLGAEITVEHDEVGWSVALLSDTKGGWAHISPGYDPDIDPCTVELRDEDGNRGMGTRRHYGPAGEAAAVDHIKAWSRTPEAIR
ncbi:hypothetical protein ACFYVR_25140 [Rhodococcus sp. NPDC003318]|uniref:hypothetical protein n=1 Tax=Rhodococcus sp. NPDC003318 TaxID=3364503 RepID=UPI0036ABF976